MGAAVTDGHSGRKSDLSVAVLTPAAKCLTPMAMNVTSVVTVLTTHLVRFDPSAFSLTTFCPRQKPSFLLRADTIWDGFSSLRLLQRIVFLIYTDALFLMLFLHSCLKAPAISHKAAGGFSGTPVPSRS